MNQPKASMNPEYVAIPTDGGAYLRLHIFTAREIRCHFGY